MRAIMKDERKHNYCNKVCAKTIYIYHYMFGRNLLFLSQSKSFCALVSIDEGTIDSLNLILIQNTIILLSFVKTSLTVVNLEDRRLEPIDV
jgi:hypothetical protein